MAQASEALGRDIKWLKDPFRWTEDFGTICALANGTVFVIGPVENNPQINNSSYDAFDQLIAKEKLIVFEFYKYSFIVRMLKEARNGEKDRRNAWRFKHHSQRFR